MSIHGIIRHVINYRMLVYVDVYVDVDVDVEFPLVSPSFGFTKVVPMPKPAMKALRMKTV